MLVQAAAQQWQVDAASCTTANGEVAARRERPQARLWRAGRRRAARRPPKDVPLKDPKDFKLIGKPLKRLDTPDKVNGKARYGIDAMLPGLKFATLAACPVFGGKVGKVDDSSRQDDARRAADRGARRSRRRGRRPHVGGQAGPGRARHHLGRRRQRHDQFRARSGSDLRAASEKDGAVAKTDGDVAKGLATGRDIRGGLRAAVPRACDHGAAELHRPCQAGRLRDLDRHPGHDARAVGGGQGRRACRSTRSPSTIICSAAASAAGWRPTWW